MMTMREYLETYDPNTPASFLTVGDVLAIYEKYDVNPAAEAYQIEHEAEESTADEWLSHLDTNPDPRTAEKGFSTQMAILRKDIEGLNKHSGYTDWKLNYKGLAESASFSKDLNAWWADYYSDENVQARLRVDAGK